MCRNRDLGMAEMFTHNCLAERNRRKIGYFLVCDTKLTFFYMLSK